MAFVYLLGDYGNDNLCKIGVTRGKIENRIKQLQTGNGNEIYLKDYYETKIPFYIEKILHLKFSSMQMLNEWFILDDDDIFNFKHTCFEIEKNILSLTGNPFMKI